MLRKIHGTNFVHIQFLGRTNINCQNGPVLPPAHVFYFSGQALQSVKYKFASSNTTRKTFAFDACLVWKLAPLADELSSFFIEHLS
jgi:hypothetical protein